MESVIIESVEEIRSLHRMLFKRKFFDGPDDEFLASPHIAAIQFRLLEALRADNPTEWTTWADINHHGHIVERFKNHVAQSDWWQNADPSTRREYANDFFAPLNAPPEILASLERDELS